MSELWEANNAWVELKCAYQEGYGFIWVCRALVIIHICKCFYILYIGYMAETLI